MLSAAASLQHCLKFFLKPTGVVLIQFWNIGVRRRNEFRDWHHGDSGISISATTQQTISSNKFIDHGFLVVGSILAIESIISVESKTICMESELLSTITVLVDVDEESPQEHNIISTISDNNAFIIEVLVEYTNKIPQKIMWKK